MEIRVKGVGEKSFTPDQIVLRLSFHKTGEEYAGVLSAGVEVVKEFIDQILVKNDFAKEDMKTSSFVVRENREYDESTRTWQHKGFIFTQEAELKFDYDKERLAKMMEEISNLMHAPTYHIVFSLKDKKAAHRSLLAAAYEDAREQAAALAQAAGLELAECVRTDFQSMMPRFDSESDFGVRKMAMHADMAIGSTAENIAETFTPEDVTVSETVYCLWRAE